MKILLTTDSYPPGAGGSGESTAALARALGRRGHDVTVVVGRRGRDGRTSRDDDRMRIVEVGLGSPAPGPGRTRRLEAPLLAFLSTLDERFDVAHAQHLISASPTLEAGARNQYPVVVTVRDYWPVCIWSTRLSGSFVCPGCSTLRRVLCVGRRNPLYWPLAPLAPHLVGAEIARRRTLVERASAVVAVSRFVRDTLSFRKDVRVIPNVLSPASARSLPPGLPERFVLFVGKLEPNKAPDLVLPILRESRVGLPLVVAGSGRLASRLEGAVQLGWTSREETLGLLERAAAVVFPSRWPEPLSRVLLEGLSVGAVLVAQRAGGNEDVVEEGESGLLGRDVKEMASQLARVLADDRLAARLREGARRRARTHFSEEVVIPQIEALYSEVP